MAEMKPTSNGYYSTAINILYLWITFCCIQVSVDYHFRPSWPRFWNDLIVLNYLNLYLQNFVYANIARDIKVQKEPLFLRNISLYLFEYAHTSVCARPHYANLLTKTVCEVILHQLVGTLLCAVHKN